MSAALGGFFGIIYQHKKYGGQLFIQEKMNQTKKGKMKRFALRYLIAVAIGSPILIVTIIVYTKLMPESRASLDASFVCDPKKTQTPVFFIFLVFYFLITFLIFAFTDSICLWAKLYDRAPTNNSIFGARNGDDDRLFLGDGGVAGQMIEDQSSLQLYNYGNSRSAWTDSKRTNQFSRMDATDHFTDTTIDTRSKINRRTY